MDGTSMTTVIRRTVAVLGVGLVLYAVVSGRGIYFGFVGGGTTWTEPSVG